MWRNDIHGHRGARGLFPENTLEGFLAATALGVSAFELDVVVTSDGVVMLSHDLALNADLTRGPDGAWLSGRGPLIHDLTYVALQHYDLGRPRPGSETAARFPAQRPFDGARMPTLASVLAALPTARCLIEVKTDPRHPAWTAPVPAFADAVLAVVDAAGAAGRVILEAFDWRIQRYIQAHRADVTLAWLTRAETARDAELWWDRSTTGRSIPACVAAEGGAVWAPDVADLTEPAVQEAHRLGLKVMAWTVNEIDDLQRVIAWDVDGLISDWPDWAVALLGSAS